MRTRADQIRHLSKDKVLARIVKRIKPLNLKREKDIYLSLLQAIVSQQLSVKAAATIWERFLLLFDERYPAPHKVLELGTQTLRNVGLSGQKAGYIKNIALFSVEKTFDYSKLRAMDDETLIVYLTQIKGVGRWTAEMILMFTLKRPDVFPLDDLGIQNGISLLYGITTQNKKERLSKMKKIAEAWAPWRTLACMYIWSAWNEKDLLHKNKKPRSLTKKVRG